MKVVLVSNSTPYFSELERSITLAGATVVAKYLSSADLEKNINQLNYDFILISDVLFNNEALEKAITVVGNAGMGSKCKVILHNTNVYEQYLNNLGIQFFYETMAPNMIIQYLLPLANYNQFNQQSPFAQNTSSTNYQGFFNNSPNSIPFSSGHTDANIPYTPQNNQFGNFAQINNQQNQQVFQQPLQNSFTNPQSQQPIQQSQYQQSQPHQQSKFGFPKSKNKEEIEKTSTSSYNQETFKRDSLGFKNHMMVVINSPKGGVGKTSIAIELATLIANRAKNIDLNPVSKLSSTKDIKVCLLDLNPSFDTMASTLNCVRDKRDYPTILNWVSLIEKKIYAILTDEEKEELEENKESIDISQYCSSKNIHFTWSEIEQIVVRDENTGLYIIPAVPLPTDVDYVAPDYISFIIEVVKEYFDVIITDTSNNLTYFTVEAFHKADEVLFISTPSIATTTVLKRVLDACEQRLQIDTSKFSLVINNPNRQDIDLDPEAIAKSLNLNLVACLPYDENVGKSLERGTPFSINNPKAKYTQEATKLAHQIIPLWNVGRRQKITSEPKRSFFRRK